MVITRHYLGEWARKKRASEIEKSEPKVYHHGQVYGTKDLKGDKALVGKYKTKEGEMKHPPKGKDEKREMASDLIREHMHHLGRHPGGPKQAIAIALHQAGLSRKKSIGKANPEPVSVPVTSTYKPAAQTHPDVQVAHQHVQDAMGKLQALHEHLSGMAQKWKAEDEETGQKRAGLLRRSLEALVEKGHRAFYGSKDAPHRRGGADTPKDAQAAEGGKGHSGFYRRKAPKGDRAMMGKGIDVLAEEGRAVARAARKALPILPLAAQAAGKVLSGTASAIGNTASGLANAGKQPSDQSVEKGVATCKGCGKALGVCKCVGKSTTVKAMEILKATTKVIGRGLRVLPTREETEEAKAKPKVETAGAKVEIPRRPPTPMEPGYRPPEKPEAGDDDGDAPLHKLTSRPSSESISRTPPHKTTDRPDLYPRRAAEHRMYLKTRAAGRSSERDEGRREVPRDVPHTSEPLRVGFGSKLMDALREAKEGSKTKKAIDILKGRMKLVTDESGRMHPVPTEHAPTMSLEKIESGPRQGQHRMIGPSHFEGGSTGPGRMQTSGGEHTQVIASSPRMHTPTPAGAKPEPSMETKTALGELKQMGPPKAGQFGAAPKLAAPAKPKTELEGAMGEIKQMRAQKALKSLLEKSPTQMSSNPMHGEPALSPRSEKPEMHHALGAAFHERRRDSSPVGSSEWERHDTLATGHAKKLAGVAGSPKAARAAIKQAHETLTSQGASAIKDRHVSPGGGGTHSLPESLLHEREPTWAQPKQSASSVRGKLMASVSGQMDKALEALLSKGVVSCPNCDKALSKPNLKRCPHCDTELPQKITGRLNPRWGFRAAGVEKALGDLLFKAKMHGYLHGPLRVEAGERSTRNVECTHCGKAGKHLEYLGHPVGNPAVSLGHFCGPRCMKEAYVLSPYFSGVRAKAAGVEKSVATAHGFKEARAMGHSLGEWSDSGRGHAIAHCKNCGEEVHAINNPSNEDGFSLHGGAVSRRCQAGAERTKMKIDDVQERVVNKAAVDPSNPSGPRPETSTPLRVGKPVGTGSYKFAKMDPFGIRGGKTQAPKQEPDKVEKARGLGVFPPLEMWHQSPGSRTAGSRTVMAHGALNTIEKKGGRWHAHVSEYGVDAPDNVRVGTFDYPEDAHQALKEHHYKTCKQCKGKDERVEKAMSARSVPRMPRALAMKMDSWRNATNVMTRANSRFSDGINTAVLLPDPTEAVSPALVDSNPVVCKGCGRSYMHKSFPAGCPTCMSRREVPGAWDFVSKSK